MKKYIVVKGYDIDNLEEVVNQRYFDGYIPIGSLVIDHGSFFQAMTLVK